MTAGPITSQWHKRYPQSTSRHRRLQNPQSANQAAPASDAGRETSCHHFIDRVCGIARLHILPKAETRTPVRKRAFGCADRNRRAGLATTRSARMRPASGPSTPICCCPPHWSPRSSIQRAVLAAIALQDGPEWRSHQRGSAASIRAGQVFDTSPRCQRSRILSAAASAAVSVIPQTVPSTITSSSFGPGVANDLLERTAQLAGILDPLTRHAERLRQHREVDVGIVEVHADELRIAVERQQTLLDDAIAAVVGRSRR